MTAYYNEIDPYAAEWLRNLIKAGHIAGGDVDERSIVDVRADDLRGYTQCHFFAGIGGWSYALRLAGWSDDRPVWTGSCPCQPFSTAGKGKAFNDERHLWPTWFSLIAECRPATVFGEQVEAAIGWGWLDAVFSDLEGQGYACGAAVLPACGVGAPHIRQRLWFVADRESERRSRRAHEQDGRRRQLASGHRGEAGELADTLRERNGPEAGNGSCQKAPVIGIDRGLSGAGAATRIRGASFWSELEWLPCTDGKSRPIEPGTFPLAHGIPGRVGRLRAYGNAIVPQTAAAFIGAFLDVEAM